MANKNQQPAYPIKVRQKWYFMVEKVGKTVDDVCALYFIPRKTYYKWRKVDQGSRVYEGRKEHPHTKIKGDIKVFIAEQKLRLNYGPKKMKLLVSRRFGVSISTTAIYKFYKKKGLVRRPQRKLPWYTPLKDHLVPGGMRGAMPSGRCDTPASFFTTSMRSYPFRFTRPIWCPLKEINVSRVRFTAFDDDATALFNETKEDVHCCKGPKE